ncbi:unnamed protein product [Microthlaspi erraticum]|uniref:Uncharacterized protein n=1 Tax=Microthlaspi erraticum TaxID=1685480 RepID=A0A6D2JPI6_9BRAS|nr:unnamed protein product [Microthlaspi erraticum]
MSSQAPNTPSHLIPSASHPSHLTTLAFHHYHHSTAFTILQKRSYSQKSEGCSRRPYRESAPNAQSGWPRNDVPRSAKTVVRLMSRPKFKPSADHAYDPGNIVPRSAKLQATTPRRARPSARAGKQSLAAAQPFAYHGRCTRPTGEDRPTSGRDLFQRMPSLSCGESPKDLQARAFKYKRIRFRVKGKSRGKQHFSGLTLTSQLDRVEAWPVELRNSTGWSSRRSSWSSRWLLPSSFAYPVELLHVPSPSMLLMSHMLQNAPKDLFQRTKHAYVCKCNLKLT